MYENTEQTNSALLDELDKSGGTKQESSQNILKTFVKTKLLIVMFVIFVILIGGITIYLFKIAGAYDLNTETTQFPVTSPTNIEPSMVSPAPKEMLTSTPIRRLHIDIQWQENELSYDVQDVFALADQEMILNFGMLNDQYAALFAVQVTDTRTFGAARTVPARLFVNIRRQSQDFPPLGEDTVQLAPGQSTTVYIPFAVPTAEQQVLGLLGNLRNPYVVELDFTQAEQLEGSFDLINGFQPTSRETETRESSDSAELSVPEDETSSTSATPSP